MPNSRLVTTTVRLRPEIHAYAKRAAELNGTSLAEFVRECIITRIAFVQGMHIDRNDDRWQRLLAVAKELADVYDPYIDP